jgi:predicted short-subunit dehydrogenase-like oxidoreductase (DUF2520 family)
MQLNRAGYRVQEIVAGPSSASRRKARALARRISSVVSTLDKARLQVDVVWLCVPDREISEVASNLADRQKWTGKVVFHSSGALPSDELSALRDAGAAVAAVHPFMTFVNGAVPSLDGVAFGIEGDAKALKMAQQLVRALGAVTFAIKKEKKAAYHAWGGFSSPLLVALLMTGEQVAREAGFSAKDARKKMMPIVRQTMSNYEKLGPEAAFTGPLVRGDAEVVRRHLELLKRVPAAREVYLSLARSALNTLPVRNRKELERVLRG